MSGHSHSQPADLKAVIFDYGEVLCHRPTAEEIQRLADFFAISVDRLPTLWERNRGPYDRGDLSSEVYWSMLAKDAGKEISTSQLKEICQLDLEMWSKVNTSMVEWANSLRSSGLKVGLLSNMHPDMVAHVRRRFAWLNDFDYVTFSGEARLIKPDPAIYELVLTGLGVMPSEALFVDDRAVNIQAARALGIRSIRFHSMAQLGEDLQAAGFVILPRN